MLRLCLLAQFLFLVPVARAEDRPLRDLIDTEVKTAWKQQKRAAAGPAGDSTFLRRVYLDLVGTIPSADEAVRFLDDRAGDKRSKLIDRLLADPRFASHQADVWDLALFGRDYNEATAKRETFKTWLAGKFARNEPHDRWVRDLLLAEQEGSEFFLVQFRSRPEDAAEAVSRLFLGTQLQCARCHDHPYESWTQRDFYGMAGFFVRLVVLDSGMRGKRRFTIAEKSSGEVLFSGAAKDQRPGRKGDPVRPKFLGGAALEEPALPVGFKEPLPRPGTPAPKPRFSRKEKLAGWVTAKDNPYFARAAVNRVWAQYMGRGLAHPVDDLGGKNKPRLPGLLEALSREFAAHHFDLKWLISELVHTQVYQLGDRGATTDAMPAWYERARVRPLTAEEVLAAMRTATLFDRAKGKLQGGEVYFKLYFGKPTNGQGEFQGGLSEHLFLDNSGQLRAMIQRRKGNLADSLLTSADPWEKRVDRLFLSVLTRRPTPAERTKFVAHLTSDKKAEPLVEEAIWALLNAAEFRFNH